MNILYPKLSRSSLFTMTRIAATGAIIAGLYGAIHDQISYTISPEYFTKFKFQQFAYADFGWPPRWFAATIGFLATWWVGLIAGWILARCGLAELSTGFFNRYERIAFTIVVVTAVLFGVVGASIGFFSTADSDLINWRGWQSTRGVGDLRSFVIVAYLHNASYLGAALGALLAVVYVRLAISGERGQ